MMPASTSAEPGSVVRGGATVFVATATTITLWAGAFVFIRVALSGLSVGGLSVGRLLIASLVLAVMTSTQRKRRARRPDAADVPRILMCGVTGMTSYQLLLNAGERTVDAGTASFLVNCGPIFAAFIAFVLLRERISTRGWIGVAVGCAGGTVVTLSQGSGLEPTQNAILVLGAAVAQSTFFVLQKPLLDRYTGLEMTCYATWAGAVIALPLLPWLLADMSTASGDALAAMVFLGVGPSAVGYAAWAYVQARAAVGTSTNSLYLVPFAAAALGWVVLGESISRAALFGGVIALTGVAIGRGIGRRRLGATRRRLATLPRRTKGRTRDPASHTTRLSR